MTQENHPPLKTSNKPHNEGGGFFSKYGGCVKDGGGGGGGSERSKHTINKQAKEHETILEAKLRARLA